MVANYKHYLEEDYKTKNQQAFEKEGIPKELDDVKSQKKALIKRQASELLAPTDWYVIKATEVESYSVPEAMTTYRANIRSKSNEMEPKIDACTTVDELAALYVYTDDSRPLGEFPTLEV